jgi:hypothetical protein
MRRSEKKKKRKSNKSEANNIQETEKEQNKK